MLHASAACAPSDVQDERVMLKRSSFHEFYFVLANAFQFLFDLLLSPFVAVDYNCDARRNSTQIELLKLADFDGAVRKRVVTWTEDSKSLHVPREVYGEHRI